jgi:RsmE family RNA methyltransferase
LNLILFESATTPQWLPLTDARAVHILAVLKCKEGDVFEAGVVGGLGGKAVLEQVAGAALLISLDVTRPPAAMPPVDFIVGLPRPPTARRMLAQLTTLGCRSIEFVAAENCDPNYARSKLWRTTEWRTHVIDGAQQAFSTLIPEVSWGRSLRQSVASLDGQVDRVALDNYEGGLRLGQFSISAPVVIAIGPERGWSAADRDALRGGGFQFAHLGERVLRVETACVAALAVVLGYRDL